MGNLNPTPSSVRRTTGTPLIEKTVGRCAFCDSQSSAIHVNINPAYIKFRDSFPMTVTGKIQKFRMRELSILELGLEEATAVWTA
jgi:fatty-acyl-CoA synthase